ncbi:tyrosine-type recombinase/integrase [Deinococcus peraridilitoris]|uniref:Site-specific recombinase XerD n=1 Tax=Deinococcus peraridilitoris (strain DSM 19664 / LMG 22246 / CIP 109416 / KR-200) TaxID=937777 RepID=L0A9E3_DEIPD|nr:tyrosine-type recombinase/integrase [Deinococcus peraridilitoris]AFZ69660.1 site-specific recombinase XerD [Deinococcus peraridilitoris DSM 19664]
MPSEGAQISPRTLRAYRVGVHHWLGYARQRATPILRPTRNSGPLFTRTLESRGLQPSSVRAYLAGARPERRAALDRRYRLDPFADAKAARATTPAWEKRQPYEEHEIQALLAQADPRHRAFVLLGAHAGLRVEEIVTLRLSDVSLAARTLHVTGKGRKIRTVNLSRSLLTALAALRPSAVNLETFVIGANAHAARKRLRLACTRAVSRTVARTLCGTTRERAWCVPA